MLTTDFRPVCDDIVNAAELLVKAFGSKVSVLHVLEDFGETEEAESYRRRLE